MKLGEAEQAAKKYVQLKHSGGPELAQLAARIIDYISSPDFALPLKEETQGSSGTMTYIYEGNATYPALFDFLSEILHSPVPIEIEAAKFGPGEIIVNTEDKGQANEKLGKCIKELQELVHAKKSDVLSRHAGAP